MRRNTSNWIAKIFAIAAAGAVSTVVACNNEEDSSRDEGVAADLRPAADSVVDLASVVIDLRPATDLAGESASGDAGPSVRRPFLVGSSLRTAVAATRHDWCGASAPSDVVDVATRHALAAAWLKDALEEHASVAAFARFSIMALAVGAPPDIIVDSQRASLDEIRHARICFGLARRYGAVAAGPGPLRVDDALGPLDLPALAGLTAQEGCVGETLGALLAERQAAIATDPLVKDTLTRITNDERRHAELAWRFVAWASEVGGAPVFDAVSAAISRAIVALRASAPRALTADPVLWHAHGRLTCAESMRVGEEAIATIVQPALAALRGRPKCIAAA